ncbi:ABC transporter ATP-binding protein [Bifidobacterium eulemuris]
MMDGSKAILQGRGLSKSFGRGDAREQVLFDVDIDVREGECLAIIGGSGSGKSTLTRILLGLETADAGVVRYDGLAVNASQSVADATVVGANVDSGAARVKPSSLSAMRKLPGFQALRRESGLVFQDPFGSLDPHWSVWRSVAEPVMLRHKDMPREAVLERVDQALHTVGLDPAVFARRHPANLSGGQAQRVAIARAIVNEPRVILADEPMSAIDVAARVQILEAFRAIRQARPGTALIVVSHDLGVVQHLADRIVVLHDGRVEEVGETDAMLADSRNAYTRQLIDAASMRW